MEALRSAGCGDIQVLRWRIRDHKVCIGMRTLALPPFFRFTKQRLASRFSVAAGWAFILLSVVLTVPATTRAAGVFRDFVNIYAGSKCLVTRCSPYDPAAWKPHWNANITRRRSASLGPLLA